MKFMKNDDTSNGKSSFSIAETLLYKAQLMMMTNVYRTGVGGGGGGLSHTDVVAKPSEVRLYTYASGRGRLQLHVFFCFWFLRGHDEILPPLIFRYDGSLHDAMDLRTILNCIKYIHTF